MTTSGYQLQTVTGPRLEPVSLAEARKQCEIDADITDHDDLLTFLVKAAREMAEEFTHRSFVERTVEMTLDAFPCNGYPYPPGDARIVLPGPVIDLVEVRYIDRDGTTQKIGDAHLVRDDGVGYVIPAFANGPSWPTSRAYPGAVAIRYRAGYPSAGSPEDAENVPARAKQAIKLLVAQWFEQRENIVIGVMPTEVPMGFYEALQGLKVYP